MEISHISKKEIKEGEAQKGEDLREGVYNMIRSTYPDFTPDMYISLDELNQFRRLYLTSLITEEKGELAVIDEDVMNAVRKNSFLSDNIEEAVESNLTVGQKLAENLMLSCLAAIQAPIIMMSQNRQEQKDRIRAEHDYKINLKAELEIKLLSEKMDHLLVHQNKNLLEIQEVQTDYLDDLMKVVERIEAGYKKTQ